MKSEQFNLSDKIVDDESIHIVNISRFLRIDNNLIRAVLDERLTQEEFWDLHNTLIGKELIDAKSTKNEGDKNE